ncbi:MAG TPA: DUF4038 domain-containing protein, partial [Verrucomicrobiae bacterium]|nr:DUF4038 domain-containing protein [Verrucomicrobiae bacterium]
MMIELTFNAASNYFDPFNEITLDFVFHDPRGQELRVPAFWDGSNVWKVRYASPIVGLHHFRSECSNPHDRGLNGITGTVEVTAYAGQNPLYVHGPLRVSADHRHLEQFDGTPFFWLADTWWMGLSKRLHWPGDFQLLAADRKEKGFNVIQIVAGLYPDMFPFDQRGMNEAGFPWEPCYERINPAYFDAADKRLEYLVSQGMMPCIVGAWGYYLPWMGQDKMNAHWRYLVARYGALPVVWCVAGEANLEWYRADKFPYDDREQVKGWTKVARSLRAMDPFHRLMTIHPTGIGRLSSRNAINDLSLIDFDMLQTPHGELAEQSPAQREVVAPTVSTVRQSYADNPVMPVIDGEASYEMLLDNLDTKWSRRMFWLCMMNGTAGHTYGANGIWQVNRHGSPHGPSPPPKSEGYGVISWDDAMVLPGSGELGMAKRFLEQFDWTEFKPHPEWAAFRAKPWLNLDAAHWIWFPEGNPAKEAPAAKRYFRRTFVLPDTNAIESALLRMSADDVFYARINGEKLGGSRDWRTGRQFDNFGYILKTGTNVLTVTAENMPTNISNPAGLIAAMEIRLTNGTAVRLTSDDSWHCSTNAPTNWETVTFDDRAWSNSLAVTNYGGDPWGKLDEPKYDDLHGPQSAGIPGVVRITYVPLNEPVIVRNLGFEAAYHASEFDPITGAKNDLGIIRADDAGLWNCPAPGEKDRDWVLILQPTSAAITNQNVAETSLHQLTLSNAYVAWHFDWSNGRLRALKFDNNRSGHSFALSGDEELALKFSASLGKVAEPFTRVDDFEVRDMQLVASNHAVFDLTSPTLQLAVKLHFQLDGPTRRKW